MSIAWTRSWPAFPPAPFPGRPKSAPWKLSKSWSAPVAAFTPAACCTWILLVIWIPASRCAPWSLKMASPTFKREAESSPIRLLKASIRKVSTNRGRSWPRWKPRTAAAEGSKMVLLLDNYDSFTYNLAQYLGELGCNVEVHRNDKISVEEIARRKPESIVISPGPCTPQDAGICIDLIRRLAGKFPILG